MADLNGIVIADDMLENVSGGLELDGVSRSDLNGLDFPFMHSGDSVNASLSALAGYQTHRDWDDIISRLPTRDYPPVEELLK